MSSEHPSHSLIALAPEQHRPPRPAISNGRVMVTGFVDGRHARVCWRDGVLIGDAEVVARAHSVVAAGPTWTRGDGVVIAAALDQTSIAATLTLMRAFTVVETVSIPV